MSTELIQSKKALFQRLCTSLLPLLRTKIEHLAQTLDPTELRKAPESQLKLSRDIQSEVDWTMDQIDSAQEEICQGACSLRESNDSDLEELNFHKYVDLIHQLDLSTEAFEGEPDTSAAKQQVDEYTSYVCREINLTTLLPQVSDFDNMTHAWYDPVPRIDRALGDFLELIKEAETGPVACPNYTPNDRSIQVVRRLVPLMKLSRLLFNKLSRPPAEEEYALLFSDLPSSQLNALTEMPNKFLQLLADLCALLKDSSAARVDVTVRRLNVLVKSLESLFNRCTNLVDYLMHQTADTAGFPIQNSLKTWLANWNPTFNLAISNIIQAFGSHNRELCECSNCSQQRY
ncbi:hypothetical protein PSHT_05302 [Puccinia striiformis]|uniref:Uncharacterized protein n=1 Tax=Puccinia striiformis TaxID=27350 RepID=A0A2S4WAR4_9BASI|nr:hypothetical protein PSHT_05302 [Puccinia striiformis]